jgi:HEAT repeat protein
LKLLRADDATTRARAAYVLGRLQPLPAEADAALAAALEKEPPDSAARPMIRAAMSHEHVRKLATDSAVAPAGRYFAAMRLAELGSADDHALLEQLLNDRDADVRVAAAYATLAIDARAAAPSPEPRPR